MKIEVSFREAEYQDCPYCGGLGWAPLFEPDGTALRQDEVVPGVCYSTIRCPNECLVIVQSG